MAWEGFGKTGAGRRSRYTPALPRPRRDRAGGTGTGTGEGTGTRAGTGTGGPGSVPAGRRLRCGSATCWSMAAELGRCLRKNRPRRRGRRSLCWWSRFMEAASSVGEGWMDGWIRDRDKAPGSTPCGPAALAGSGGNHGKPQRFPRHPAKHQCRREHLWPKATEGI